MNETNINPDYSGDVQDSQSCVASVIVPSLRGYQRIGPLLESLERQDFGESWEVVVIVDGPCPATEALLASWRSRLSLRWLVQDHAGVPTALNRGLAAARGEIVVRCDDDLTVPPHWLTGHVRHHRTGAGPVGVISATRDSFPEPSRYAQVHGRPANERGLREVYAREPARRWIHWAACNSAPRQAWLTAGGLDPGFGYGEDSEFGWRLQHTGVRIVIDPALEVVHRGPARSVADRLPRGYLAGAARRAFRERHRDSPGHRGAEEGRSAGAWGILVALCSQAFGGIDDCRRAGRMLDRGLALLPRALAAKLIDLALEAAAVSGERHGVDGCRPDEWSRAGDR